MIFNHKKPFKKFSRLFPGVFPSVFYLAILVIAAYMIGVTRSEVKDLRAQVASLSARPAPASAQVAGAASLTGDVPKVSDADHIRGNRSAEVFLIEYSDLECPFCKQFHPTAKKVLQEYGDRVAWVYRHYPLNFHANAQKEAEAVECAFESGGEEKFWQYVDKIFERTTSNGTGFALTKLGPLAAEIGLDQAQFQECLDSGKYTQMVKDQMAGGSAAGVSGTPGNVLLNSKTGRARLVAGALPFEQIKIAIDEMLK